MGAQRPHPLDNTRLPPHRAEQGKLLERLTPQGCSWMWYARQRREPVSTSWHRTISDGHAHASATSLVASWTRSNSCCGTFRSRLRNGALDASNSRDCGSRKLHLNDTLGVVTFPPIRAR